MGVNNIWWSDLTLGPPQDTSLELRYKLWRSDMTIWRRNFSSGLLRRYRIQTFDPTNFRMRGFWNSIINAMRRSGGSLHRKWGWPSRHASIVARNWIWNKDKFWRKCYSEIFFFHTRDKWSFPSILNQARYNLKRKYPNAHHLAKHQANLIFESFD